MPELTRIRVGDESELVASPWNPTGAVLPVSSTRLLDRCDTFAPLEAHAAHIRAELGLDEAEHDRVLSNLLLLAKAGALASERQLVDRYLRPPETPEPAPVIARVGIPTCQRPDLLVRCLESHVEETARNGRRCEFVVADDATSAEARAESRARMSAIAGRTGAPLFYAGREEKESFAAALAAEAGVDPALVRFALLNDDTRHFGAGANRNVLLLHGVGEPLLLVDDDTMARVAPAPGQAPGAAFSSEDDPTEFWFPAEGQTPADLVSFGDHDLLQIHESLLGRRVTEALGAAKGEGQLHLDRTAARSFQKLGRGGGRVVLTAAGVAGDSGIGSPAFLLFLTGDSRARLHAGEATYHRAFTDRQLVRAVVRPTVADSGFCMGLDLGVDQRDIVPPFMPVERNEDGVFGAAVRAVCDDGFFGFLPWAIQHLPPGRRGHDIDGVWKGLHGNNANDMLVTLIRAASSRAVPGDRAARISWLAQHLLSLGRSSQGDFDQIAREHVWRERVDRMARLETRRRRHGGQPRAWAAHVDAFLGATRGALDRPDFARPRDLAHAFGPEQASSMFRKLVHRYGELLSAWPALVQAATRLAARGVRPGVAIPET